MLNRSPEPHQSLVTFSPQPCTGVHHQGGDLEGVEGAQIPHTSLTQLTRIKPMAERNSETQILELNEDQLEAVEGGAAWPVLIPIMIDIFARLTR